MDKAKNKKYKELEKKVKEEFKDAMRKHPLLVEALLTPETTEGALILLYDALTELRKEQDEEKTSYIQ